jgi:transposase
MAMANKLEYMYKIKEAYRLLSIGTKQRQIAKLLGMSRNTITDYQSLAKNLGMSFRDLYELSDEVLLGKLSIIKDRGTPLQDARHNELVKYFDEYSKELCKTGVTLKLLWEEYKQKHPLGYSYMQFTVHYKRYAQRHKASYRHTHVRGEVLMVDYAGDKLSYVNSNTGEIIDCDVLVCILPYSGYTFAYATHHQRQPDLVHGLNEAFKFYGGAPKAMLTDNLRAVVKKSNKYEPDFTELACQLASHYQITLQATRVAKPTDKGLVENAVKHVYLKIHGPLRNAIFTSLSALNAAIAAQLIVLNTKAYQGKIYSRADLFVEEKLTLQSLPNEVFEVYESKDAKVQKNYHIQIDQCYYSVPYSYIGKKVNVRYNTKTIEIYSDTKRVAIHDKLKVRFAYSTTKEHMPPNHAGYYETRGWNSKYFIDKAITIGPYTELYVRRMLENKIYVEQTYTSCIGLFRLVGQYSALRVEQVCKHLQHCTTATYKRVEEALRKNLTEQNPPMNTNSPIPSHPNVRPSNNYK